MKRLTVTCKDEDLVKLVGTCVKINADFAVESISEELKPTVRRLHREKESAGDKVLTFLSDPPRKGHATFETISALLRENGYADNTCSATLSKLQSAGLILRSGNIFALVVKNDS